LQELSESLIASGVGVRVIAATQKVPGPDYVAPVPVFWVPTYGETQGHGWKSVPWVLLLLCRVIWRLLRDVRHYDVVLVSGFNVLPLAPVFAKLLTRKPCVVRPESPLELKHAVGAASLSRMGMATDSPLLRLAGWLRGLGARRVDRYIAISGEIRAKLLAEGIPAAKIVEISNGINMDKFVPVNDEQRRRLRQSLRLPEQKLLLVYTGRLAVSKGVMILMEVWSELAARHPEAHLLLVGEGAGSIDDCEAQARAFLAERRLEDRVTFAGAVANVHEYLKAADVFVFPSFYEGFGLSILEAMAVGLPMVCSRVGVAADLESAAGIRMVVAPRSGKEFLDSLELLLRDTQLRLEVGAKARAAVQGLYSMTTVAEHHAAVFSELARERS